MTSTRTKLTGVAVLAAAALGVAVPMAADAATVTHTCTLHTVLNEDSSWEGTAVYFDRHKVATSWSVGPASMQGIRNGHLTTTWAPSVHGISCRLVATA